MVLLILAEAALVYGALICAVYVRFGVVDAAFELQSNNGFVKAGIAAFFCLAAFYLFDLYDFLVMHDRRELVLRLIQALGLAWIVLALIGTGVQLGWTGGEKGRVGRRKPKTK